MVGGRSESGVEGLQIHEEVKIFKGEIRSLEYRGVGDVVAAKREA